MAIFDGMDDQQADVVDMDPWKGLGSTTDGTWANEIDLGVAEKVLPPRLKKNGQYIDRIMPPVEPSTAPVMRSELNGWSISECPTSSKNHSPDMVLVLYRFRGEFPVASQPGEEIEVSTLGRLGVLLHWIRLIVSLKRRMCRRQVPISLDMILPTPDIEMKTSGLFSFRLPTKSTKFFVVPTRLCTTSFL